jgi:hypothetical protein
MFKVQGSLVPPWVWTMVFLWKVMFYELRYQLLSSLSFSLFHTHTHTHTHKHCLAVFPSNQIFIWFQ